MMKLIILSLTLVGALLFSQLALAQNAANEAVKGGGPCMDCSEPDSSLTAPPLFDPSRDAMADVDAALVAARESGRHVMIVYGGDWCHDSEALVAALSTPRALQMLASRYEIAWVHVPFSPDERSIPAASRFGLGEVEGTPTVLLVTPEGTPVNLSDAPRWRNAASRKPAAIVRHFEHAVMPVNRTSSP